MEQLRDTYEVNGFLFQSKEEAERAQRELDGIQYIKGKIDLKNSKAVFQVYQNLMKQNLFETLPGYCFLKELRDCLLMAPDIRNEDVAMIAVHYPEKAAEKRQETHIEKEEPIKEKKSKKKEKKEKNRNYKARCHFFMIVSLILAISVATMMFLAATSDNVNILNYENKILNRYSAWEEELKNREQLLKEAER